MKKLTSSHCQYSKLTTTKHESYTVSGKLRIIQFASRVVSIENQKQIVFA